MLSKALLLLSSLPVRPRPPFESRPMTFPLFFFWSFSWWLPSDVSWAHGGRWMWEGQGRGVDCVVGPLSILHGPLLMCRDLLLASRCCFPVE